MKILVVCQYFHPEQFRVNDVCFELVAMGHEVTVLTGLPNYPSGVIHSDYRRGRKRRESINGVDVVRAPLVGRGTGSFRLALNYLSFALSSSAKALLMQRDFDVIFVYQLSPITMAIPALLLKQLTGRRVLLYCQDLWPESVLAVGIGRDSLVYDVLLTMSRWIYRRVDRIAISSRMFQEYFKDTIGLQDDTPYLPVYADSHFEEVKASCANGDVTNLVFAGNIGEMQSIETIVRAASELRDRRDIRWHIVGDGSARQKCELLTRELGLDTGVFYGHRPVSDMSLYYSMADAFLVTLKADKVMSYTLPYKVQSYMASGKPIIAAIDGETRMVIEEARCGSCCGAEDYVGLAKAVMDFADQKGKYQHCGSNARAYYEKHFRKDQFMEKLVSLLREAAEGV